MADSLGNTTKNSKRKKKPKSQAAPPESTPQQAASVSSTEASAPLFPAPAPGKRPDYGTNDTLELLERIPSQLVEMKLDDVLDAVKTVDNLCDYSRCKAKTSLMGHDCQHCSKRFCFKHALPEVHGCAEAVKQDERKKFLHPDRKTGKTIREEQDLAKAKKKLEAKLKDMKVSRMQKTGGKSESRKK